MKKVFLVLIVVCAVISSSCELESSEDKAIEASKKMCECLKKKTVSKCEEELNDKYGSYWNDDDFIKTFNEVNDCNVTISKKQNK